MIRLSNGTNNYGVIVNIKIRRIIFDIGPGIFGYIEGRVVVHGIGHIESDQ
jgi:hypothetical protein